MANIFIRPAAPPQTALLVSDRAIWDLTVYARRRLLTSDHFSCNRSCFSTMEDEFGYHASAVKNLKAKPSDEELLCIYGLYKQATVGDCTIDQPSSLDLKATYKYNAWNERKGMSQNDAKTAYVKEVGNLVQKYGSV